MPVRLNHTIVHARDKRASAEFLSEILGLGAPVPFGPFLGVRTANDVTLDFLETDRDIQTQHYAFHVCDDEFDRIFAQIKARRLRYWADPGRTQLNQMNHWNGGRGIYFEDPAGHLMEILTRA
jgi:catechol 2,3-dioxygenase-like lactoylglutathione lyase family enzyme